jgi:hypothetical protein
MTFPDHSEVVDECYGPGTVQALIGRAHWQNARSVQAVAPHSYCVKGWDKDDLTEHEFWLLVQIIKTHGRREEWVPPAGFYTSGSRRPMTNTYLYVSEPSGALYAYWFTFPRGRVPMLNREHVSVQQRTPTRRVVDDPTR